MVLTAVSSAWPQNGRHASQPSWRNVHRTRHALSCRVEPKRYRSGSVRQRPTGRRPLSLQPEKRKPPVGCGSPGRRQSRSLRQQSHPTRVVAGVDILRHTSAHKGSPLFRRRAPAANTVDPRGLLTARGNPLPDAVRRPLVIDGNKRSERHLPGVAGEAMAFSPGSPSWTPRRTPLQKGTCAGQARRGGRWPRRRSRLAWRRDSSADRSLAL